jgi:alpha-mannosidase
MPLSLRVYGQTAYFADGFHGGTVGGGGYPVGYTQFIVHEIKKHTQWKVNLEIEPGTWDTVEIEHPSYYEAFKSLLSDSSYAGRIDFANPSVAQSYLLNISGESIIRQFQYGMKKLHQHFPQLKFLTYAPEEPCWTSALPEILSSLGFKYIVLKNPNTCWGGYSRAHGGELVNWIGPDGTSIKAVPRYTNEELQPNSTWQTTAFGNSSKYIQSSFQNGIRHPVGMTYQDCGWRFGPWLDNAVKRYYQPTEYVTWSNYFEHIAMQHTNDNWHLDQEDLQVALMWGSQVLQRIAREERKTNNTLLQTGKIASMAKVYANASYPHLILHKVWRNLLVSQHHDVWIVPYNMVPYYRHQSHIDWAEQVKIWANESDTILTQLIDQANNALSSGTINTGNSGKKYIRVYNTSCYSRTGIVSISLPDDWLSSEGVEIYNQTGNIAPVQITADPDTHQKILLFQADIPPMGYAGYKLTGGNAMNSTTNGAYATKLKNGKYRIETNLYTLILDPAKGGTIESLIAKKMRNRQFIDRLSKRKLNELRGYFYDEHRFYSSTDDSARVSIIENGPIEVRLKIEGHIAASPFTQYLTLAQNQRLIDLSTHVDWKGNPGIGEFEQNNYKANDRVKAFYNDLYKLHVTFPLNLSHQQVYKNAPFDVMKSHLKNTFFNRWDSIKNNIILNWVDVTDSLHQYGLALLTDHTTSYLHGQHHPLGLTIQYSGKGLWGRDYRITGPTDVHYAIIPHQGRWDKAGIWQESDQWNQPLITKFISKRSFQKSPERSLINISGTGYEISSVEFNHKDMVVRFFNVAGNKTLHKITFDCVADSIVMIQLNGEIIKKLSVKKESPHSISVHLSMPRFGIRTLKLVNVK